MMRNGQLRSYGRQAMGGLLSGRELTLSSKETMPWFPLPMPENEVDLLDGFKRSTRPATVSEKPMLCVSLDGSGGSEEREKREEMMT